MNDELYNVSTETILTELIKRERNRMNLNNTTSVEIAEVCQKAYNYLSENLWQPHLLNAGITAHDDYLITQALNNLQEIFENTLEGTEENNGIS